MKTDAHGNFASASEKFSLTCRKCGSDKVEIWNDVRIANDGDGYVDRWGGVQIVCRNCKESEILYEP